MQTSGNPTPDQNLANTGNAAINCGPVSAKLLGTDQNSSGQTVAYIQTHIQDPAQNKSGLAKWFQQCFGEISQQLKNLGIINSDQRTTLLVNDVNNVNNPSDTNPTGWNAAQGSDATAGLMLQTSVLNTQGNDVVATVFHDDLGNYGVVDPGQSELVLGQRVNVNGDPIYQTQQAGADTTVGSSNDRQN